MVRSFLLSLHLGLNSLMHRSIQLQMSQKYRVSGNKCQSGGFRATHWDLYIWLILSICSCACVLVFQ